MALVVQDRVKVNTTTTGTGTIVLSNTAPTGYQSFAVIGDANTTYYTIASQSANEWEVGIGTYFLANSSLSRTTILSSSAANAAVSFSAGTKDVFVTYPANRAVYEDETGNVAGYPITGGTINGTVIGGSNAAAGKFTTLEATGNTDLGTGSANYIDVAGGAANTGPVISTQGSDTNVSMAFQAKGTGALNLAPGSSGVNISNGNTVTAITRTSAGSGYTSFPTGVISAPTTSGGVQATISFTMFNLTATIQAGGSGYTAGDVLTVTGGTTAEPAMQYTVSTVSSGAVTAVTATRFASYSVLPTNPASVTGGTGTNCTLNITYGLSATSLSITNAGSGYVQQPTVTFSGGGGSGAAAHATVGSDTTLRSIGTNLFLNTPNGIVLRLADNSLGTNTGYVQISNAQGNGGATITTTGTNANTPVFLGAGGTGAVNFFTGSTGNRQLLVAHTASAVNYVQATGGATGANVTVSAQGSDTNISLALASKGTGPIFASTGNGLQFRVSDTFGGGAAANYWIAQGRGAGAGPFLSVAGSDTNINAVFGSKGTGNFQFSTNNGAQEQARITHTANAVNYIQLTGAATNNEPAISAQGSDTNIDLVLSPKGTGALQAQATTSTTAGGNARGANAVDWQTSRSNAARVASGTYTVVSGGNTNSATAYSAATSGGESNQATANYAFIGGGSANTASGVIATIGGGQLNTAAGYFNFIGGGFTNSGTALAAVTTQATTAVTSGSTAVTLSATNANIKVGQYITGTGIASDTYVSAISTTSLTLSKNATATGTPTLSFFTPHGVVVGGGNNQATGSYSFIGGGGDAGTAANRNVASGDWATVGGGLTNTASGIYSSVAGGRLSTASAQDSHALGSSCTASSTAAISIGFGNISNGVSSAVLGASRGNARSIAGNTVFAASNSPTASVTGITQSAILVLGRETTDATPTALCSNTAAAGTTNQVILPNNSAYYFKASIISGVTGGGNSKAFTIEGLIKRGANAASTAIVGTPVVNIIAQDAGASAWDIAATADTTNGGLRITFTGQAGTTIRTVCKVETTEMTF
jgi:hypothetical protein